MTSSETTFSAEIVEATQAETWRTRIVGGAMALGSAALAAGIVSGHIDIDPVLSANILDAQPSTAMTTAFDVVVNTGAVAGIVAIGKRGVDLLRSSKDTARAAIEKISKSQTATRRKRRYVSATLLATSTALATGSLVDIAEGVGGSQASVAEAIAGITGSTTESTYIVSNDPDPSLTSNLYLPLDKLQAAVDAQTGKVKMVPATYDWRNADVSGKNFSVLTLGLGDGAEGGYTGDEDCVDVPVSVAEELGLDVGDVFTIDGVTVKVDRQLTGKSGMNILPVVFSNKDYAQCMRGEQQSGTFLIGSGDRAEIESLLRDNGLGEDEQIAERAYVVSAEEYIANSRRTSEESGYPLVLQAIGIGGLFAALALSGKAATQIANQRKNLTMLVANGMSEEDVKKIYGNGAGREALESSFIAFPLIFLVDAYANSGIPGATMGPSVKTLLFVTGLTYVTNKAGTSLALRRQFKGDDLVEGGVAA